jgi:hypothetical protein
MPLSAKEGSTHCSCRSLKGPDAIAGGGGERGNLATPAGCGPPSMPAPQRLARGIPLGVSHI